MNIRKFDYKDKEKLIDLWKRVFPDDPPHNEPGKVIAEKLAIDDLIFVVECDENIIGACMAGYDGHRGWLYAVAVDKEFQRRGVGKELAKYAIASLKKIGCGKVNLQIRAGNSEVEHFYKSLGFKTEDRISMGAHID